MKKKFSPKVLVAVSLSLILIGAIMFGMSFVATGGHMGMVWTEGQFDSGYVQNPELPYKTLDSFENIEMNLKTRDIRFIPAEEYAIEIVKLDGLEYSSENNKLIINDTARRDRRGRFELFNFKNNNIDDINIYYPRDSKFGNVALTNNAGSVDFDDIDVGGLTLDISYGNIKISNSNFSTIAVSNNASSIALSSVKSEAIDIQTSYSDITFREVSVINDVNITASSASFDAFDFICNKLNANVKYGSFNSGNISTNGVTLNSSASSFDYNGVLKGDAKVDLSYGSVVFNLDGNVDEYLISNNLTMSSENLPSDYNSAKAQTAPYNISITAKSASVDIDIN